MTEGKVNVPRRGEPGLANAVRASLAGALLFLNVARSSGGPETFAPSPEPTIATTTTEFVPSSRGNVTLEGPSGMFINPTSATIPAGEFSIGYCALLVEQKTDILQHVLFFTYGVRDWLELGVVGDAFDFSIPGDVPKGVYITGGPMVRLRVLRDTEWRPEVSIGGYSKFGTPALDSCNVFLAASKTIPISQTGIIRSLTAQGGFREGWLRSPERTTNRFYGGLELQLPYNLYVVGEVTQFASKQDKYVPWAVGLQWRGKRFGLSAALVQGGDDSPPSIMLGIGGGLGAEPARAPTRPGPRP
jgi:hypothetical protein